RLLAAVKDYLAELEGGRRPDRAAFARRHPELGPALEEYLRAVELMHGSGPDLSSAERKLPMPPVEPLGELGRLGDFQIVREVGRGGMGVVYEAVQLSLGRRVALKVLPFAAALDAKHLQRFKNEAMAAAQLHHTNIVPVYFVGEDRNVHFYAMQLIE